MCGTKGQSAHRRKMASGEGQRMMVAHAYLQCTCASDREYSWEMSIILRKLVQSVLLLMCTLNFKGKITSLNI